MSQYINLGILLVVFYVVYYVLERLNPVLRTPYQPQLTYEELSKKYGAILNKAIMQGLVGIPVLTVVLKFLLYFLIMFRLSFLDDAVIMIPPPEYALWILAAVLSIVFSFSFLTTIIYYKTFTDWEEYLCYLNIRVRFDFVFYANYLGRILSLLLILATYMMFDWFYVFGREEVKLNDFFGLGTAKYAYEMVEEVKVVEEYKTILGNHLVAPYYKVTFKDGATWNSFYEGYSNFDLNAGIITKLVLPNSKAAIKRVEFE